MIINQYKDKYSKASHQSLPIQRIFENISKNNIKTPKTQRIGNVFATTTAKGRKHEDIVGYNGLLFIDVDDCIFPADVKETFIGITHTLAVWYSSSGNVHALIKIPICRNLNEFKRRYKAFIRQLQPYIEGYAKTIDTITVNPSQLAFESYDSEIYVNDNPIPFKYILPKEEYKPVELNINATTKSSQWCIAWVQNHINDITDNGYPQVLTAAYTLGGYAAAGYVSQHEAMDALKAFVRNNVYLNSNESSGNLKTYLSSAESAFNEGLKKPLVWGFKN
tara:strand:- start:87 stop:920 length:834 start_codon:yes stop_codon:yes gene_type:complete